MTDTSTYPEIYVLADGEKVLASSPVALLEHMRSGSFDPQTTMDDYMMQFSERLLMSLHKVIRFDTPENFVADLKKCGVITDVFPAN